MNAEDILKSNNFKDAFINIYKNSSGSNFKNTPTVSVGIRFPGDTFTKLKAISRDMNTSLSKLSYLIITAFVEEYTKKENSDE